MSTVTTQFRCELCGRRFEKHWGGTAVRRFCSIVCRNRHIGAIKSARGGIYRTCPSCNHRGYRQQDLCKRCGGVSRHGHPLWIWDAEKTAYLRAHYPSEGADAVATHLNLKPSQVIGKANSLGLRLSPEATRRRIHARARQYMQSQNPMKRPEVRQKVRDWWETHPEEAANIQTAFLAGHARLQKDRPSKLEQRLRDWLEDLGITFEPSAVIKPGLVVDIRIGSLIIQADGDYWHGHPRFEPLTARQQAQQARDRAQDAYLHACGLTVTRLWECELTLERIRSVLEEHGIIPSLNGESR